MLICRRDTVQHVGLGQAVLAHGPRYRLDLHAALATLHASHGIQQMHRIAPDRDELEAPHGQYVISGRALAAARAVRLGASARPNIDLDGAGGLHQPHGGIDEPREVVTGIEQTGKQHGRLSRQQ